MLVHLVGDHLITYTCIAVVICLLHASITICCQQYFMPKRTFLCSMITFFVFYISFSVYTRNGVSPVLLMLYRLRGYRRAYRHCVRVPTLWGRTWTMCR